MMGQKRAVAVIATGIFACFVAGAIIFIGLVLFVYNGINFEADDNLFENSRSFESTVFYADGSICDEEYEPVVISLGSGLRKTRFSIEEISHYLTDGIIAVEDKKFYLHHGVDFKRTAMAALNYITKSRDSFGASTITQQVVKNISGDNNPTLKRKAAEIIRAMHLERNYSKDEIFDLYLNIIPMGENIYGVGEAAKAYFGKTPDLLSVSEAATLIGITNAPTAYSPYLHPDVCLKKRNIVLGVMFDDGVISEDEYRDAISDPLEVIPRDKRENTVDSWFVEVAIEDITKDLSEKYHISTSAARMMLMGGGYKIYTTMNVGVQEVMERYFEDLSNLAYETKDGLNYAMTVIDSKSGYLVGVVGRAGQKAGNRLFNHATALHPPASCIKPLSIYAPMIDDGIINWASVLDDVPVSFNEREGEYVAYPRNSPDVYDGLTTVKDAIRLSKNTVAVRLCGKYTPKRSFDFLKDKLGFDTMVGSGKSNTDIAIAPMALGQMSRGVSLIKLTEAYGIFPSDGIHRDALSYLKIFDYKGRLVIDKEQNATHVVKASTARIMNKLLECVILDGTARSVRLRDGISVAGKTGTSSGNKDKLFIGYTPYYLGGIWCGYDNGSGISSQSKSHLHIWAEVMDLIHENIPDVSEKFSVDGLEYLSYCVDSGCEFDEVCTFDPRGTRREWGYFSDDNKPRGICERHIICMYDSLTKAVACECCPRENLIAVSLIHIDDRRFPKEIIVTDAEYVYRDIARHIERPIDYAMPYFEYALDDGVYVGKSRSKKQFNSNCYIHCD